MMQRGFFPQEMRQREARNCSMDIKMLFFSKLNAKISSSAQDLQHSCCKCYYTLLFGLHTKPQATLLNAKQEGRACQHDGAPEGHCLLLFIICNMTAPNYQCVKR